MSPRRVVWFDPFGWLSHRVPERWLHRSIRGAAALVLGGFLVLRVGEYHRFALKPLWAVETLLFAVLIVAYAVRVEPVDRARGARDILVPLLGGVLPFGLLASPPHPAIVASRPALLAVFWGMAGGTALTVWAMWCLRGAFSITVEARSVVRRGPYRWIRHPVYLGEMMTAAGVAAWRFSVLNCVLLAVLLGVQLLRARWEEEKLERIFPEYRSLRQGTWWFG